MKSPPPRLISTLPYSSLPIDHHPRFSSTVPRAKIHSPLSPSVLLCDAPRRNLSRRDPMYFRHFTRVLSSMDADSSIARSDRCLFTGLQREVINYRLTRVNGRGEKERERIAHVAYDRRRNNGRVNRRKESRIFFENGEIFHRHFVLRVFSRH